MSDAWLDDFFDAYFRRRPVNATFAGIHDYDCLLPDLSSDADEADRLLTELRRIPSEELSAIEEMDLQLAEGCLRVQRWEATSRHFVGNPVHFTGEAIFGVIGLLLQNQLESASQRLQAIPASLEVAVREIGQAPAAWIARARRECTGAHLLLEDVVAQFPSLAAPARGADAAFGRLDAHLASIQATSDYACGGEAFDLLLRWAHFSQLDADALERLALERIAEEEAFLASTTPPAAPPSEIPPEYISRFQTVWQSACDLARTSGVLSVPDWPVRFVERPLWARRAAPYLYFLPYRSPPPFDAPDVVDYFVPPQSDASTIKLNHVVHHASWGHHFQNWSARRAASRIGQIAAVDCASRIAMLCGGTMAEGWANYAVDLAEEGGFLTPMEQYGQHHARMRMAARAIVDVRLHQHRITLDEAAAFYAERVGMSDAAARSEAVKNSLFPAAACMYLLGWYGIWQLRRQLQSRYSLQALHDQLLSFGSVPVSLIARAMLEAPTPVAQA